MSGLTIPPEEHTYDLPTGESATIRFFADGDRFRHLLEDHVLSAAEPWERLVGAKFRNALGQKMAAGDVSIVQAALNEAFAKCLLILHEGISFSVNFPVYVAFTEQRRRTGLAEWHESRGYYFLSEDGLLIVVRADILRTAYFRAGIKGGNLSKKELFYEAWKSVKDIVRNRLIGDTKGTEQYKHVFLRYISAENWQRCPDVKRRGNSR